MSPRSTLSILRAVPLGAALFPFQAFAAPLPQLAAHLQLDALHLEGSAPSSQDSGSFVRLGGSFGPGLSGSLQGSALRLERDRFSNTAQLEAGLLKARVEAGAAFASDRIELPQVIFRRRAAPETPRLELAAGRSWWACLATGIADGGTDLALSAGHRGPLAELSLSWRNRKANEAWHFSLPTGEGLPLQWNSRQESRSVQALLLPGSLAALTARLETGTFTPTAGTAFWNLTDSGTASRWSLGWTPSGRGWRAGLVHTALASRLTTLGWGQDSSQERRRFHALDWRADGFRQEAAFETQTLALSLGRQEMGIDLTSLRFPFLAWNALDNSEWGGIAGILETRNDRLSGEARLESQWFRAESRHRLGWLDGAVGLELGRYALSSSLPWSRRKRSITLATSLETDTLDIRPLEAWILWPSLHLSRSWDRWETSLSAMQAIPLRIRQESAPANATEAASPAASPAPHPSGGLALHLSLMRRF